MAIRNRPNAFSSQQGKALNGIFRSVRSRREDRDDWLRPLFEGQTHLYLEPGDYYLYGDVFLPFNGITIESVGQSATIHVMERAELYLQALDAGRAGQGIALRSLRFVNETTTPTLAAITDAKRFLKVQGSYCVIDGCWFSGPEMAIDLIGNYNRLVNNEVNVTGPNTGTSLGVSYYSIDITGDANVVVGNIVSTIDDGGNPLCSIDIASNGNVVVGNVGKRPAAGGGAWPISFGSNVCDNNSDWGV